MAVVIQLVVVDDDNDNFSDHDKFTFSMLIITILFLL